MRKGAVSMAVAAIAAGVQGEVQASETAGSGDLDQVVVTGQRLSETLPQQLAEFGVKVETISAQQIRNGGYVDVSSALQALVPGLYVASKNGPFDYVDISLHGSRRQDVLWLVDGVRINNRLYGGTTPLDTIPASMVERIEVLYGGQALFYGTQSPAGAVNIVTKAFTLTPNGEVSLGGDSNNGWHVDADFRNSVGKNQFVLFASLDESDGYQPHRDSDYQPSGTDRNRDYNVWTVGAKYGYEFGENMRFEALVQHNDGKLDFAQPAYTATAFNERSENLVSTKLDYTISDSLQFFVKAYGHWWDSHYTEFDNVIGSPGDLDVIDDHDYWGYRDYGLNAMAKVGLNTNFDLLFGYDFQAYSGSDAVLVIQKESEHVNALFAQIRNTPALWPKVHLAAGVRYNDPSFGQEATVWNVSGQFDFTDSFFGRLSGGTSFRLPTAEELFADDPNDERGNPNLKPERGQDLNVSLGGHFGIPEHRFDWELSGFYRNVKDLISFAEFDEDTNQDVATNTAGEVKIRGVEVDLKAQLGAGFSGGVSYSYNHSRDAATDLQIIRVPEYLAKAVLDYSPANQRFGATVTVNNVGKTFANLWDGRETYGKYTLVDLAGRVYLDAERHSVINLRIENLFDKEYAAALGTTQRDSDGSDYTYWNRGLPRTFTLRYSYRF
ncbi:MAG: TonB-dependent receptor [Pseudomonadota bacterium]